MTALTTPFVQLEPSATAGTWTATMSAPARAGTLALFSGVLTLCDLDIAWASVRVHADGTVHDSFEVTPTEPGASAAQVAEKLEAAVADAWAGRLDIHAALAARRASHQAQSTEPPVVEVDSDSEITLGIRVRAADRPGLLHDVALAISQCGLRTRSITVLTIAGVARDTFRVVDANGRPPSNPHELRSIQLAVLAACS